MEFVMRYLFWIVLVVIVALAGGFYFLTIPALRDETTQLQSEISKQALELKRLAKDKDNIKTPSHVEATRAYAAKLVTQDQAVKAQLKGKGTSVDPKFQQAPADPLRFDEWLIGVRKEILDQTEKAGLVLPLGFAAKWLDEGQITSRETRDGRLARIAFISDVIRLLCEVRANVSVLKFAEKPEQAEATEQVSVGVYSLDAVDWLDAKACAARERDYLTHGFGSAAKAPPALKDLPPRPYKSELLDIKLTAPMSVVPQVVQAFETCPRWFGIVRKVDCQRVVEPYAKTPLPAASKGLVLGADGRPSFVNSHYQEAPVQVQFWLELLTLDEKALK